MAAKMEMNSRKRYFTIDENVSSEEIYALLDGVDSADELNIDNLMNDSDTEYIAEEEIQQDTHDTSIIIPEANIHVVKAIPIREEPKKGPKTKRRGLEMGQEAKHEE